MAFTDFTNRVYKYCTDKGLLVGVSCIVAGLSGGPDSVALVCALSELRDGIEEFPKLYAVHVNHGLRESAGFDEELSAKLCDKLNVPFTSYHVDVKAEAERLGRGLEETGRKLRYEAFGKSAVKISEELGIDESSIKIATAHHLGDLSETFMMNLFRGTGLEGLTAMNGNDKVIRPLLDVTKDDIGKYLKTIGEGYAVDETNLHTDFTRNKWRNEIFPLIASASNKDPKEAISDTYELLKLDEDYLSSEALNAYESCLVKEGDYRFIKTEEALALHPAIINRVIRLLWKDTFGNLTDFETCHLNIVKELMEPKGGTRYGDMPFGRTALSVEGLIGFFGDEESNGLACAMSTYLGFPASSSDFSINVSIEDLKAGPKIFDIPGSDMVLKVSIVENTDLMVYNVFSWICPDYELVIGANPTAGAFQKAGNPHETDLKKLLSDMKVPRDARSHLLTVRREDKILWIPGIGHSEGFVSDRSRRNWLNEDGNKDITSLIKLQIVGKGDDCGSI